MKTKLITKTLGILLSATIMFSSIAVSAETVPTDNIATSVVASKEESVVDIFGFDWKTATIEEINEVVYAAEAEDLGVWLKSLPEGELEELLKLDTYLHNEVIVTDYSVAEDGNMEPIEEHESIEFYEYALNNVPENQKLTLINQTGRYYYDFDVNGVESIYRMDISDIDQTTDASTTPQKVTLALSIPVNAPSWLSLTSSDGTSDVKKELQLVMDGTNYTTIRNTFAFNKPAGYNCTFETNAKKSKIYYYDNGNYETSKMEFNGTNNTLTQERFSLLAYVHVNDAGIGTKTSGGIVTDGTVAWFKFHFYPITYYMEYDGNGATEGSMENQACQYDEIYTPSANRFSRQYLITYNANDGIASKASDTVDLSFAGWGLNDSTKVTHSMATQFVNASTTNSAIAGTFYAIWTPKSTNLATASRTGYEFTGWLNSADNKMYESGAAYAPMASSTMTAQWNPNKYTVKFNSNGGEAIEDITTTYDTEIELPVPTRAGYDFVGWSGSDDTYTGTVKNLSTENNATINLTAQWKARSDTPYKVLHLVQEARDSKIYVEKEVEEKTGTTGENVTPTTKNYDGYTSPDKETKKIEADGSTIFEYKYDLEIKKALIYKVEHYLQNKTDPTKYDLVQTDEYETEEGTTVTPDIITTFEDYNVPNPETVMVTTNGTTIKYYYTLKENSSSITNNNSNTGNHVSESTQSTENAYSDINNFKSGEIKYYTDSTGNVYEIYVNPDGTLTIRDIKLTSSSEKSLNIAGTLTVNGVNYQVSEIAANTFKNNKKIETVTIGNGITKIGMSAFQGCTKLKTVKGCKSVTTIESKAFYGCTALQKMATSKPLIKLGSKVFYNCKNLKSYTIGKYVKSIGSYAFYNCKQLKKITIAESIEIIEQKAFYGCKNLKNIDIKTTKLTKVGNAAFKKCNKKLTFKVPAKKKQTYQNLLKNKY